MAELAAVTHTLPPLGVVAEGVAARLHSCVALDQRTRQRALLIKEAVQGPHTFVSMEGGGTRPDGLTLNPTDSVRNPVVAFEASARPCRKSIVRQGRGVRLTSRLLPAVGQHC